MIAIRKATLADVPGIEAVVRETWKQDILPDVCKAQTRCQACALYVAAKGDDVAGFVSAFLTVDKDGKRRWEVDLLAVRPASQGQRLGQQLVEAACTDERARDTPLARAAIHVDNVASQKTFENAGFKTDGEIHRLLTWTPAQDNGPIVYGGSVTLIPVDTLTYRGLWLEGLTAYNVDVEEQRKAVMMARSIIAWEGRHNTGAMTPAIGSHRLAADLRDAAEMHGEYRWFVRSL
ncbi:MAG: GNAT family N-acetyltransferase [Anaerolineae bacterium]|nr:GNAT family N-acetyltransferase [Anaerolineae bacterium]